MKKLLSIVAVMFLVGAAETDAQRPPEAPAAPSAPRTAIAPEPTPPRVERDSTAQPVNIRFDITVIDEGASQPMRKTMSLTLADQQTGLLRSSVVVPGIGEVPLHVDITPSMQKTGKVRARISLDYRPQPGGDGKAPTPTSSMRLAFTILLESGQKVIAAQAADPMTDRRVSVEVTGTVLK